MTEQYIPNLDERAVDELFHQFRGPNTGFLEAFAEAFGETGQDVEDKMFGCIMSSRLSTADGDYLEQWGDLVGESRGTLDDDFYRRVIRAKAAANRSDGHYSDTKRVVDELFDYQDFKLFDYYPALLRVVVFESVDYTTNYLKRSKDLIERATAAGVETSFVYAEPITGIVFGDPDRGLDNGIFSNQIE